MDIDCWLKASTFREQAFLILSGRSSYLPVTIILQGRWTDQYRLSYN